MREQRASNQRPVGVLRWAIISGLVAIVVCACLLGIVRTAAPPPTTPVTVATFTPSPAPVAPVAPARPESLTEKWRIPIIMATMLSVTCQTAVEVATDPTDSNRVERATGLGVGLAAGGYLDAARKILDRWTPPSDQVGLRDDFTNHLDDFTGALRQWVSGELAPADIPNVLGATCEAIKTTGRAAVSQARTAGLTDETINEIARETIEVMTPDQ